MMLEELCSSGSLTKDPFQTSLDRSSINMNFEPERRLRMV